MELALLHFLAMTFTPAIAAAARPGLTFAVVQVAIALAVRMDWASLPPSIAWLASLPALLFGALFAALETASRHDEDLAGLLRDLHLDSIGGAFGAFTSALLFAALGLPEDQANGLVPAGQGVFAANATETVQLIDQANTPTAVAAVGGAVGLNLGLTWARAHVVSFLEDLQLARVWAWVESGGVVVVLALLPLVPLLLLAGLVLFSLLFAVLGLRLHLADTAHDRLRRSPCGGCGYALRVEASVCPECRAVRTPAALERAERRWLSRWRGGAEPAAAP